MAQSEMIFLCKDNDTYYEFVGVAEHAFSKFEKIVVLRELVCEQNCVYELFKKNVNGSFMNVFESRYRLVKTDLPLDTFRRKLEKGHIHKDQLVLERVLFDNM